MPQVSDDQTFSAPDLMNNSCTSAPTSRLQVRPDLFRTLRLRSTGAPRRTSDGSATGVTAISLSVQVPSSTPAGLTGGAGGSAGGVVLVAESVPGPADESGASDGPGGDADPEAVGDGPPAAGADDEAPAPGVVLVSADRVHE